MTDSSESADALTMSRHSRCSGLGPVSRAASVMPRIAFIGVRISWLTLARNSDLARLAASASSLALRSWTFCRRVRAWARFSRLSSLRSWAFRSSTGVRSSNVASAPRQTPSSPRIDVEFTETFRAAPRPARSRRIDPRWGTPSAIARAQGRASGRGAGWTLVQQRSDGPAAPERLGRDPDRPRERIVGQRDPLVLVEEEDPFHDRVQACPGRARGPRRPGPDPVDRNADRKKRKNVTVPADAMNTASGTSEPPSSASDRRSGSRGGTGPRSSPRACPRGRSGTCMWVGVEAFPAASAPVPLVVADGHEEARRPPAGPRPRGSRGCGRRPTG